MAANPKARVCQNPGEMKHRRTGLKAVSSANKLPVSETHSSLVPPQTDTEKQRQRVKEASASVQLSVKREKDARKRMAKKAEELRLAWAAKEEELRLAMAEKEEELRIARENVERAKKLKERNRDELLNTLQDVPNLSRAIDEDALMKEAETSYAEASVFYSDGDDGEDGDESFFDGIESSSDFNFETDDRGS